MNQEINVLALVKGRERYIVMYDDNSRMDAMKTLAGMASNPDLSFTWYDVAVMSQKIRQESHSSAGGGLFNFSESFSDKDDYNY